MLDGQPLGEYPEIPPCAATGDTLSQALNTLIEIVTGIPVLGSQLQLGAKDLYPWYLNGPHC